MYFIKSCITSNHVFHQIKNAIFKREDGRRAANARGGIGAASRIAAAHRAADTNAPGDHLKQTPGEGACFSHVAACAVLRPPAPPKVPHNVRVPAKGRADWATAWAYGVTDTGDPVATSHRPSARWPAPHLVHLAARRRACWRRVGAPAHFTSSVSFRALCRGGLQGARTDRQAPARPMVT